MRDVETLRHTARRAYERGRLLSAARVGWLIAAVTLVSALETGRPIRTIALGFGLWLIATIVRWRLPHGFAVVGHGLQSGAVPLAAALVLCRLGAAAPPDTVTAICGSAGLCGGVLLGRALVRSDTMLWQQWLGGALVASAMATLGCLAFGIGTAVGAAAGMAAGAGAALLVPRRA